MLMPAGGATEAVDPIKMIEPSLGNRGHRRLDREQHALEVDPDHLVEAAQAPMITLTCGMTPDASVFSRKMSAWPPGFRRLPGCARRPRRTGR
jgi:hypothetical protein